MKKQFIILLTLSLVCLYTYSQNESLYGFYYANGIRHYWQEDLTSANIIVRNTNHLDSIVSRLEKIFNGVDDDVIADDEDNNIFVNSQSLALRNISELISSISLSNNDIAFFTYAKQVNGNPIWLTNEAYVKLKDSTFFTSHVQPVLLQYPSVVSYYEGDNEYRFVCPTDSIVVTLANRLYDTAFVVYSSPDYYSLGEIHNNDTYYSNQWNLNNTGQNGGTIGVDIKAEKAWSFLQKEINAPGGNVKVAVIDDGVADHEDFYEENGISVVLDGYTANGVGTGRPLSHHWHGECCAGIISAVHNNIGVAGVAPHSKIVPIRIFRNISNQNSPFYMFPQRKVAMAIKKSWEDLGAYILSCSWGGGDPNDFIIDAIIEAATSGREGKGCIVCFSSGNTPVYSITQPVTYQAALDEVLAVGAVYNNGSRHGESCYGMELDLVAPGYAIPTTDREGTDGMNNGNYFMDFQRTSAACPHASGVAALMLSARPELTREQVYEILESTAQKVGNYGYNNNNSYYHPNGTWHEEVGHGLVDAHMAVVEAALFGREVSLLGEDRLDLCDESVYTCSIYHPDNFTFEWTCSNNLAFVSLTNFMAKVMPIATGSAFVQVDVYSEGRLIRSLRKYLTITDEHNLSLTPLSSSPISVTSNTVWSNNNHFLPFDVMVENGATLTITGKVHCSNHANIIVKPGGRLIINGGTLTNSCPEDMWPGIQVWGNSSIHQYPDVSGNYAQGYLELKNDAVIENAICAVELWRPGYYNTTGGIIHAEGATFRNNGMAVHALWYTNYDPGHTGNNRPRSYNAYFKDCEFVIDTAYIGATTFHRHVDLAYVDGFDFQGCRFSVSRHIPGVSLWCNGILANQASVFVNSYCANTQISPCPDNDLIRSSFFGFHSGVYAANDGSGARTFRVRNSDFLNNDRGIYALNTGYATIAGNSFSVGCGGECAFGIYSDHVTGFCIEDNVFAPWHNSNCPGTIGIAVVNSCSSNEIHRNQFGGLVCANVAVGQNFQNSNGSSSLNSGLTYSCNDNTSGNANTIDFCVVDDSGIAYSGIQQSQGSMVLPAGNTFGGSQYHFYNEGNHQINYYFYRNQFNEVPNMTRIYGVDTIGTVHSNSCPPHYGIGPVIRSEQEKAQLASEYLAAHSAYNSLKQIYDSRIDGGNTPAELADITNATPSDMWQLRAQLLGHSPYLSQEVLTTAADRDDVFTNSVLFEILSANPDELKKDTLISYLESKDNPLPDYMIGLLRQIANGATARTALEAEMAKYSHDFRLAAGDIVRSNLNDSVANPTELRTWLAAMEDIAADRLIVASYMEEGNYTDAFTLANMLPDLYELEGDGLADHTDYMRLLDLYRTLGTTGRTVFEMTEEETEMVEGIADYGKGTSQAMAEALLSGVMDDRGDRAYFCPDLPKPKRGETGRNDYSGVLMNEALGFRASVSPSPATTWTTVDYTLPAGATKAVMTLTTTMGVKVMEVELNGNQGSKVLDLRSLAAGVYVYSIRCGEHVQTGKLVITK